MFAAVLLALSSPAAATGCLMPTSDRDQERIINNALSEGGDNEAIQLCPNTIFNLSAPVTFTHKNQELSTAGYPNDGTRAMLVVTGPNQSTAVIGQCVTCSGTKLMNVQIDGSRPKLGRIIKGGKALIEFGGSVSGQLIKGVRAFEPRGWSTLRIFEGKLDCNDVSVISNEIGPSGRDTVGEWADGISYGCQNGHITGNVVIDATDGGIVLFQAPGTIVDYNTVIARTRTMLGGINLVDIKPYGGDFRGVVVTRNKIVGDGGMIKVGIAMGHEVWWTNSLENYVHGAKVVDNVLRGSYFGYGLGLNGVRDFEVGRNTVDVKLNGVSKCDYNPGPTAALRNPERSSGKFDQQSFTHSTTFRYLICISPF